MGRFNVREIGAGRNIRKANIMDNAIDSDSVGNSSIVYVVDVANGDLTGVFLAVAGLNSSFRGHVEINSSYVLHVKTPYVPHVNFCA